MPRGKVLGGTSSINATSFIRGAPEDYNGWAALGCRGWDFETVLPYFRRLEDYEGGADEFRGAGGPLSVSHIRSVHPLSRALIESCVKAGMTFRDDINKPPQMGVGYMQASQRKGWRHSASRAYLWPAKGRANLRIVTHAQAAGPHLRGHPRHGRRVSAPGQAQARNCRQGGRPLCRRLRLAPAPDAFRCWARCALARPRHRGPPRPPRRGREHAGPCRDQPDHVGQPQDLQRADRAAQRAGLRCPVAADRHRARIDADRPGLRLQALRPRQVTQPCAVSLLAGRLRSDRRRAGGVREACDHGPYQPAPALLGRHGASRLR